MSGAGIGDHFVVGWELFGRKLFADAWRVLLEDFTALRGAFGGGFHFYTQFKAQRTHGRFLRGGEMQFVVEALEQGLAR